MESNTIGHNAAGTSALGNGNVGVRIAGSGNFVTANAIGFNTDDGVRVDSGTGNRILENRMALNGGLGINLGDTAGVTPNDAGDVDAGPNNLNFPVLSAVAGGVAGTEQHS